MKYNDKVCALISALVVVDRLSLVILLLHYTVQKDNLLLIFIIDFAILPPTRMNKLQTMSSIVSQH